jgi:alanine racemase
MSTDYRSRAWVEVDAGALRRNLEAVRNAVGPGVGVIPMVKADAYGVGLARAVSVMDAAEPLGYGVATAEEGRELRDLGVDRPVFVVIPLPPESYECAVRHRLTVSVSELAAIRRLGEAAERSGTPATFHVEVDTGMGRAGFDWKTAPDWVPQVSALARGNLTWSGCFTHFHSADVEGDSSLSLQWRRFESALIRAAAGPEFLIHACNSAAALRAPAYGSGAVRPGIFLYGGRAGEGLPGPEPVVSVRARVVLIREVDEGVTVGYGATHAASARERWASVAIGYGDGLPRSLGNRGAALVRGRRAPIIGRISMDVTVVDISGIEGVEVGDPVTLIGSDGPASISLEEVAELASTINYEILTGLTRRLPRIWSHVE